MIFNFIQPLDLEQILVANFAGTSQIFLFIAIVFISALAGRFRMPNMIALPMIGLFIVMLMGTSIAGEVTGLYLITLILVSLSTFWALSKGFKN